MAEAAAAGLMAAGPSDSGDWVAVGTLRQATALSTREVEEAVKRIILLVQAGLVAVE